MEHLTCASSRLLVNRTMHDTVVVDSRLMPRTHRDGAHGPAILVVLAEQHWSSKVRLIECDLDEDASRFQDPDASIPRALLCIEEMIEMSIESWLLWLCCGCSSSTVRYARRSDRHVLPAPRRSPTPTFVRSTRYHSINQVHERW